MLQSTELVRVLLTIQPRFVQFLSVCGELATLEGARFAPTKSGFLKFR